MLNVGSKQVVVVVGEKRLLVSLPPIQRTTNSEVDEILVVGQHLNTMLGPGLIGSPFDEGRDDSCKLLVVDQIFDFRGSKLPGVEATGCRVSSSSGWDKTAPMAKSEASVSTWKG